MDVCGKDNQPSTDKVHNVAAQRLGLAAGDALALARAVKDAEIAADKAVAAAQSVAEAAASLKVHQALCNKAAAQAAAAATYAEDIAPQHLSAAHQADIAAAQNASKLAVDAMHQARRAGKRCGCKFLQDGTGVHKMLAMQWGDYADNALELYPTSAKSFHRRWQDCRSTDHVLDWCHCVCHGRHAPRSPDPGLLGPQGIVFVTTAVAAAMIVGLLATTYSLYHKRQDDTTSIGFKNFQKAYPLKVCISPQGDLNLPITECTALRWACQQHCQMHNNTWPIWFIVDSPTMATDLISLAHEDTCVHLESHSSSLTRDQRRDKGAIAQWYHDQYSVLIYDNLQFDDYAIIPYNSKTKNYTDFALDAFIHRLLGGIYFFTSAEQDKALSSVKITAYERSNSPVLGRILESALGNYETAMDSALGGSSAPPINLSGINGTIAFEASSSMTTGEVPSYLRLNFGQAFDVTNDTDPACMEAMIEHVPGLQASSDNVSVSLLALAYDKDEREASSIGLVTHDTVCNGVLPAEYIPDDYHWSNDVTPQAHSLVVQLPV